MKVTVDLRSVLACVLFLVAGVGLHALAAPPTYVPPAYVPPPSSEAAYPVTPPSMQVMKWFVRCVGSEAAGVEQTWPNHDLDKPNGWNPYLAKAAADGWEPTTFIAPTTGNFTSIVAVCFRKPDLSVPPAPRPMAKTLPPVGTCTAQQLLELQKAGISESAIQKACGAQ